MALGRCLLKRRLGQGAMGDVYLARHRALDLDVAVKVLSGRLARQDKAFVDRFIKEAQLAVRLNHPNVVRVYDVNCEEKTHYIVMEYVNGGSLADRLEKGRICEAEALTIARAVAAGLEYAAKQGIVHRDIKPDNIMLSRDGDVKIADLGLAKETGAEKSKTMSHSSMGTPHYISPEQASDAKRVDCRTDIYSLGATLYHALAGVPPFDSDTSMGVLLKHLREAVPDVREANPEISAGLARMIMKMMQKAPECRYQSAAELIADIDRLREGRTDVALDAPSAAQTIVEAPSGGSGGRYTETIGPRAPLNSDMPHKTSSSFIFPGRRLDKYSLWSFLMPFFLVGWLMFCVLLAKWTGNWASFRFLFMLVGAEVFILGIVFAIVGLVRTGRDPGRLYGRFHAVCGIVIPIMLTQVVVIFPDTKNIFVPRREMQTTASGITRVLDQGGDPFPYDPAWRTRTEEIDAELLMKLRIARDENRTVGYLRIRRAGEKWTHSAFAGRFADGRMSFGVETPDGAVLEFELSYKDGKLSGTCRVQGSFEEPFAVSFVKSRGKEGGL